MLVDKYNRVHDYLRISLTDSCNFRCTYCMPHEDIEFLPHQKLMQKEEIIEIAKIFVSLGVNKIRLTGGEPLVRKDFEFIARGIAQLPVELTLTTNGVLVGNYIHLFKELGIHSLNVSLDTLNAEKFASITKRNQFSKVWEHILLLLDNDIKVKINVVVMKGINDEEVSSFVALTQTMPIHVRFIEFMPFDKNNWNKDKVITTENLLNLLEDEFDYIKLKDSKHDTAKKYKLISGIGTFAFITTMSQPFCSDCNRMRLTADGKMKNCLFGKEELDVLAAYRSGQSIIPVIEKSILSKFPVMGGQFKETYDVTDPTLIENRSMIKIGG